MFQLLSARDMAQRTYISKDQIVYSTDKDLYEQDYEASEWDQRFREIEKTDWAYVHISFCLKPVNNLQQQQRFQNV